VQSTAARRTFGAGLSWTATSRIGCRLQRADRLVLLGRDVEIVVNHSRARLEPCHGT
jgi:hypothetical protein